MTDHPGSWPAGTPCWIDLMVDDPEATRRFYAEALGWQFTEPLADLADYATALVGGRRVAGIFRATRELRDVPHAWLVHLATDDAWSLDRRATAAGARSVVPPTDLPGAGTTAVWVDPGGAPFGAWQAREHTGFDVVDEEGAPTWCDLMTPEYDASRLFYGGLFGYSWAEVGRDGPRYSIGSVPGSDEPVAGMGEADGQANWGVGFHVADVDAAAERVARAGGTVADGPFDFAFGRMAVAAGPGGESFSVITPRRLADREC